jgi:hypothetical protein
MAELAPWPLAGAFSTVGELSKVTLAKDWSAGDLQGGELTPPPTAHMLDLRDGSEAKITPAKLGVTAAFSRVDSTSRVELNEMGPVGTDGPDGTSVLRGSSFGQTTSQVQIVGLLGTARQQGTASGGEASPDACGLYGRGSTEPGAIGRGIGGYLEGSWGGAAAGGAQGLEVRVKNNVETTIYQPAGISKCVGIWINASSNGAFNSGCAVQIGRAVGRTFEVGFAASEGSITGAAFRDDSEALRGLLFTKPHAKAAIAVSAGAGPVIIGAQEAANASALLEINGGNEAHDPCYVFKVTGANNIRGQLATNGSGNISAFAAGGTNSILTGTLVGDSGITYAAGKAFHIGAQGKTSLFRMEETKIGLYGVAPVIRAVAIAEPAETLAGLKAAVNSIRTALKNIGITE